MGNWNLFLLIFQLKIWFYIINLITFSKFLRFFHHVLSCIFYLRLCASCLLHRISLLLGLVWVEDQIRSGWDHIGVVPICKHGGEDRNYKSTEERPNELLSPAVWWEFCWRQAGTCVSPQPSALHILHAVGDENWIQSLKIYPNCSEDHMHDAKTWVGGG